MSNSQQVYVALYHSGVVDREHELNEEIAPGYRRAPINIMEIYLDGDRLMITNRHDVSFGEVLLQDWPIVTGFAFVGEDGDPVRGANLLPAKAVRRGDPSPIIPRTNIMFDLTPPIDVAQKIHFPGILRRPR